MFSRLILLLENYLRLFTLSSTWFVSEFVHSYKIVLIKRHIFSSQICSTQWTSCRFNERFWGAEDLFETTLSVTLSVSHTKNIYCKMQFDTYTLRDYVSDISGHSLWTRYFQIFLDIVSGRHFESWILDLESWLWIMIARGSGDPTWGLFEVRRTSLKPLCQSVCLSVCQSHKKYLL